MFFGKAVTLYATCFFIEELKDDNKTPEANNFKIY
jgi:hypothetical protein